MKEEYGTYFLVTYLLHIRSSINRYPDTAMETAVYFKNSGAKERMKTDGGGVASTDKTHQTYRRIFLQACHELKIPDGQ